MSLETFGAYEPPINEIPRTIDAVLDEIKREAWTFTWPPSETRYGNEEPYVNDSILDLFEEFLNGINNTDEALLDDVNEAIDVLNRLSALDKERQLFDSVDKYRLADNLARLHMVQRRFKISTLAQA